MYIVSEVLGFRLGSDPFCLSLAEVILGFCEFEAGYCWGFDCLLCLGFVLFVLFRLFLFVLFLGSYSMC